LVANAGDAFMHTVISGNDVSVKIRFEMSILDEKATRIKIMKSSDYYRF